ncbi:hypothetical protein K502DRAFT_365346 [Neoconidiobolus thromboides FSU 785]|nr:hypothetical protein K502DRAFT_365346 [Neoconidiobolus thromboides FSU 785]
MFNNRKEFVDFVNEIDSNLNRSQSINSNIPKRKLKNQDSNEELTKIPSKFVKDDPSASNSLKSLEHFNIMREVNSLTSFNNEIPANLLNEYHRQLIMYLKNKSKYSQLYLSKGNSEPDNKDQIVTWVGPIVMADDVYKFSFYSVISNQLMNFTLYQHNPLNNFESGTSITIELVFPNQILNNDLNLLLQTYFTNSSRNNISFLTFLLDALIPFIKGELNYKLH